MDIVAKMKRDWNRRGAQHARFWIATEDFQDDERFARSGEITARELLEQLRGEPIGGWSALEIGCGIGRVLRPLAPHFDRLCGIDVSHEMIRQSRDWLAGLSNVRTIEGSGVDLGPFASGEFDLVYAYVAFQHMPRPVFAAYLREVHRVLRPSGQLVFQIPLGAHADAPLDDTVGLRAYASAELDALLADAGLALDGPIPPPPTGSEGSHSVWLRARKSAVAVAVADDLWREQVCPDRLSPLDAHLQRALAERLRDSGQLAEAARVYATLLDTDDSEVALWLDWIDTLVAQRDVDGALAALDRLARRHPDYESAAEWRAQIAALCPGADAARS